MVGIVAPAQFGGRGHGPSIRSIDTATHRLMDYTTGVKEPADVYLQKASGTLEGTHECRIADVYSGICSIRQGGGSRGVAKMHVERAKAARI